MVNRGPGALLGAFPRFTLRTALVAVALWASVAVAAARSFRLPARPLTDVERAAQIEFERDWNDGSVAWRPGAPVQGWPAGFDPTYGLPLPTSGPAFETESDRTYNGLLFARLGAGLRPRNYTDRLRPVAWIAAAGRRLAPTLTAEEAVAELKGASTYLDVGSVQRVLTPIIVSGPGPPDRIGLEWIDSETAVLELWTYIEPTAYAIVSKGIIVQYVRILGGSCGAACGCRRPHVHDGR